MAAELGLQASLKYSFHHLLQEAAFPRQLQLAGVDPGQHIIETARGLQRLERLPARIQPVYLVVVVAVTGLTVLPNNMDIIVLHLAHAAPTQTV